MTYSSHITAGEVRLGLAAEHCMGADIALAGPVPATTGAGIAVDLAAARFLGSAGIATPRVTATGLSALTGAHTGGEEQWEQE